MRGATEWCWNCGYDHSPEWRFCPNCGIWLVNAAPLVISRSEALVIIADTGEPHPRSLPTTEWSGV